MANKIFIQVHVVGLHLKKNKRYPSTWAINMNQHLQHIFDFIENAKHLSEEDKTNLVATLKKADRDLTISEFKLERTEKVKRTTAILLEETIEELEQKRKAIEDTIN